ncbi:MAG: CRISPR-associated helicase Cas3' [Desulfurococcales archaeon]|nr:CRISPR-associated helicase Cas3' [Desulfurococcales archaeon]
MRPIMEAAYEDLASGRIPIVVAPTGYGKTRASPEIYNRARQDGLASGLVHVAPLRSLVRRIYLDIFKDAGGAYQMHDPRPGEDKSPYLLRPLVVTTLDSFTYNMYRLPVLESLKIREGLSYGHYYPVYTSVLSSVVVFDEAHLYLSDEASESMIIDTLKALTSYLARAGASLIIETATMRPSTIASIASAMSRSRREIVVRIPSCPERGQGKWKYRERLCSALCDVRGLWIEETRDESLEAADRGIRWDTKVYSSWESALAKAKQLSRDGRVLIVANTVPRAIWISERLGGDALLIHGRLSAADRERAEEELGRRDGPRIIVSTQVIEAGVDVNSIAVITEAAPIESLVQRAGRACRRGEELEYCRENGAHIGIVHTGEPSKVYPRESVEKAVEAVRQRTERGVPIDWRAPCPGSDAETYTSLIAEADAPSPTRKPASSAGSLLEVFLESDGVPDFIQEISRLEGWCGLVRNTIMMPILVEEGDSVVASLEWALARADKILEKHEETGAPLLVGIPVAGDSEPLTGPALEAWRYYQGMRGPAEGSAQRERNCYELLNRLARDQRRIASGRGAGVARYLWAFKAKPGAYVSRKGFTADMPKG